MSRKTLSIGFLSFFILSEQQRMMITKSNVLISIRSKLSIKPTLPFGQPRTVATLSIEKCSSFNFHGLPVNFSRRVFTSNGSLVINLAICGPQLKNETSVFITYPIHLPVTNDVSQFATICLALGIKHFILQKNIIQSSDNIFSPKTFDVHVTLLREESL